MRTTINKPFHARRGKIYVNNRNRMKARIQKPFVFYKKQLAEQMQKVDVEKVYNSFLSFNYCPILGFIYSVKTICITYENRKTSAFF